MGKKIQTKIIQEPTTISKNSLIATNDYFMNIAYNKKKHKDLTQYKTEFS